MIFFSFLLFSVYIILVELHFYLFYCVEDFSTPEGNTSNSILVLADCWENTSP